MPRIILDGDERDFLVYRESSGGTAEILDIAVGSGRREGKGRKLVAFLLGAVAGKTHLVWAMTRDTNEIAKQFYEGIGFRFLARVPAFYREGDAVLYGRDLP